MITVRVLTGVQAGTTFTVSEKGVSVGRSKMADIKLEDGSLSRLHCSFSIQDGQAYVQDLNSSNGTSLNGVELDDKPHLLRMGDVVTVGDTALLIALSETPPPAPNSEVPSPTPPLSALSSPLFPEDAPPSPPEAPVMPAQVDLGLGEPSEPSEKKKMSPVHGIIFALSALLLLLLGAFGIFSLTSSPKETPRPIKKLAENSKLPFELNYERLKMDGNTLFRYTLTYTANGELTLSITDLGDADRSFTETQQLSAPAQEDLRTLVLNANYKDIPEMCGFQTDDGTLERRTLLIVYGAEVWSRTAENDPDAHQFHTLCDRLTGFANLKLGVNAIEYSTEELTTRARERLEIARLAWDERDLAEDKLHTAVRAYMEGLQLLRTLNPKPDFALELTRGLKTAEAELEQRYKDLNFNVQQALQTKQYANAQANLQAILRMIPDREDRRNIDATEQLLSVESMLKNRRP